MEPRTDWQEAIAPDEAERFERLAERLRDLQRARGRKRPPVGRGLHTKANVGLEAEFRVLPDLPATVRAGVFARPAAYRAYVRFSNGMGVRQADARPDVRGVAVKVVGVGGRKLLPGLEDAKTQDFLLIRTPATPFRDAEEFLWFVFAARSPLTLPARAALRFGPLRTAAIVAAIARGLTRPLVPLAGARSFSAAAIRCGAYAARYQLVPREPATRVPGGRRGGDFLRAELAERLAAGPVTYDFRLQLYADARRTPIEDASRAWSERDAPPIAVAELTLPRQELESPRGRAVEAFVERLSFDPWHATADLRPLGNLMRARRHAYRLSTLERGAAGEPDGGERFDAGDR